MKQGARIKLSLLTCILLLSTVTFFVGADGGDTYAFGMVLMTPYNVTFVESGLAPGTSWSVTFNGGTQASTSDSINFVVPNGVYDYSVHVPSGYTSPSTLSGTVTVSDSDVTKPITFIPVEYVLTMHVVGEGTVSPGNGTYSSGASVPLTAIASAGWSFSGWSGDASGTTNTTITMDGNKAVTATFTQNEYTLTILVVGEGTVSLGNGTYLSGASVSLMATSSAGWSFSGWSGDASGTGNTIIVMDGNKAVTATFTQNEYNLTILVVGEGTVSPGNGTHLSGATVSLEAMSADGWTFSEWSGDASGTTNTTITMDGNKAVTATFTQNVTIPEFPLVLLLSVFLMLLSAIAVAFRRKISEQSLR
jgi:uncharacterized repeat protein (TIGR02543 family)